VLVVPAFAKINLALEVVARRPDGYHDLDSILAAIDWHDLVGLKVEASERTEVRLFLRGPRCGEVPPDGRNLAVRAAQELAALSGARWNIEIGIDKRVPVGAGLGGGSSDAAAVLSAGTHLMRAGGVRIDAAALREAALRLGSDVPALLAPGTLRIGGRGDVVECFPNPNLNLVVVATVPNSTAAVFAAVTDTGRSGRADRVAYALRGGAGVEASDLGSALEAPAARANALFAAELARLRAGFETQAWHVTGSGGAAFTLTRDRVQAVELAAAMLAAGWDARPCRTVGAIPRGRDAI
jgi:4-diphosphocytidyl-2-C-methyl-D-erythritol kinase